MAAGKDMHGDTWGVGVANGRVEVVFEEISDGMMEFTPDQAREFIEAVHDAIVEVEG